MFCLVNILIHFSVEVPWTNYGVLAHIGYVCRWYLDSAARIYALISQKDTEKHMISHKITSAWHSLQALACTHLTHLTGGEGEKAGVLAGVPAGFAGSGELAAGSLTN